MAERGRPVSTDPTEIAVIALELFDRHGYSATTMDDVAQAAGVSRSTLFRYFPNKADLLWSKQDDYLNTFRRRLAEQPTDRGLLEAVLDAHSGEESAIDLRGIRELVRTVGDPEAFADAWRVHGRWQQVVIDYVAERQGLAVDSVEARATGSAIWAVIWAGVVSWAGSDEPAPHRFMDQARQAIRSVLE